MRPGAVNIFTMGAASAFAVDSLIAGDFAHLWFYLFLGALNALALAYLHSGNSK